MLGSLAQLCCVPPTRHCFLPAVFRQKGFTAESCCLRRTLHRPKHALARGGLLKGLAMVSKGRQIPQGLSRS